MHPEALFKTAKTEQFRGLRADQAWNLAGSLVGIDMDETYFQRVRDGKSKACTTLDLVVFQQHQESLQLVESWTYTTLHPRVQQWLEQDRAISPATDCRERETEEVASSRYWEGYLFTWRKEPKKPEQPESWCRRVASVARCTQSIPHATTDRLGGLSLLNTLPQVVLRSDTLSIISLMAQHGR
jgi:hypothetical protein